jgi:tRNA-splicing endonuclease subunit Sen34
MMEEEKIKKVKLILINERALTFNADDYIQLRTKHRMMGKLIGAAVPYPRNVTLNGLPALFTDIQTRFMLERGIVELISGKQLTEPPTEEMKDAYENHKIGLVKDAERFFVETRLEVMREKMEMIIQGKRAKLIKKGVKEMDIKITADEILSEEEKRIKSSLSATITYAQIPTEHPIKVGSSLIRDYPVSNSNKYKVFKDLWQKGFYITNGESFGGDFLVYSDDPMFFHASQIIHVVDVRENFELYFPVSCTRLAVSVKKKCVFAYVGDDGKVTYQTMLWDNPKLKELYAGEKRALTCTSLENK